MQVWVAPSEPGALKAALGPSSVIPEMHGADVFAVLDSGLTVGIQRKEYKDLEASINDGRLAYELAKLKRLDVPVVVIEGISEQRWSIDGAPMGAWSSLHRNQYRSLTMSMQIEGHKVIESRDVADTAMACQGVLAWAAKGNHRSLMMRPKFQTSWGVRTDRDWGIYFLMGLPGISTERAQWIFDHFNKVPVCWEGGSLEEMLTIRGIGPGTVEKLAKAMPEAVGSHFNDEEAGHAG